MKDERTATPNVTALVDEIRQESAQNVNLCFQCQKCAAGCPLSYAMDYTPTQLVHAIRLGLDEMVMASKTTWLCASCQTCTTRCPQGLDIARIMDSVKIISQRGKHRSPEPLVLAFYRSLFGSIFFFGRVHEITLVVFFKLRTGRFFEDLALGWKMLLKGKLKLFPLWGGGRDLRRIRKRIGELERGKA